jgi:cytoskeletal protein RodZ
MVPKAKREVALKRSVPMLEIHRPTSAASSAFTSERPASSTTSARPSDISPKYSGELNESAKRATGGAISIRPTTPTVPATKDAMAAMPSAAPARPLRAIW